jgi:hypothetical protein
VTKISSALSPCTLHAGLAKLFLILTVFLCAGIAQAQNCPPGYVLEGGQGAYGCAPTGGNSGPAQYYYGTFYYGDGVGVLEVWNYHSQSESENAALADCVRRGGTNCRVMQTFWNQCGAAAMDRSGAVWFGLNRMADKAEKAAMDLCGQNSQVGRCSLQTFAFCTGSTNEHVMKETLDGLEKRSAKLDKRHYWGALADSPKNSTAVYDLPTQAAAEAQALSRCPGCKILVSFESSCAGQAWPKDPTKAANDEIAVDVDPAVAKSKAMAQCEQKYGAGACNVSARCSGRQYLKNNPDAPDHPPSGH